MCARRVASADSQNFVIQIILFFHSSMRQLPFLSMIKKDLWLVLNSSLTFYRIFLIIRLADPMLSFGVMFKQDLAFRMPPLVKWNLHNSVWRKKWVSKNSPTFTSVTNCFLFRYSAGKSCPKAAHLFANFDCSWSNVYLTLLGTSSVYQESVSIIIIYIVIINFSIKFILAGL